MIALIQRVNSAQVTHDKQSSSIGPGLLVFLGIHKSDTIPSATKLANKLLKLRILADEEGKMNLSLLDVQSQLLVVSQFTLIADVKGNNRPSFISAAYPDHALSLYEHFVSHCKDAGIDTHTGFFGKFMSVELTNDGPTTIILDTQDF